MGLQMTSQFMKSQLTLYLLRHTHCLVYQRHRDTCKFRLADKMKAVDLNLALLLNCLVYHMSCLKKKKKKMLRDS
jgi:hypothetical protein